MNVKRNGKKSFLDSDLNKKLMLTSANSINIARWIPQMLYYFIAYKNLNIENLKVVFLFQVVISEIYVQECWQKRWVYLLIILWPQQIKMILFLTL